jgi:hypothetical protein
VKAWLACCVVVTSTCLCVAEATGAPYAPTAALARAQSVTLNFVRFYSNVCNCYRARVSGQISSGAGGEDVVILRQYCGRSFGTAVGGTQTREGGFFETEVTFVGRPDGVISESYRARRRDALSEAVFIRGKLTVLRQRLKGRRDRVVVSTQSVNPVSLKGRQIVLQRQVGTDWTRIASARLAPHPVKYYTFVATFTVPRRGWTVRALVPARSAAPCFTASASEKWTS